MPETADLAASLAKPAPAWNQGDVVESVYFAAFDKSMPGVLVTPACDVEQEKVDLWTLVALFPDAEVARAIVAKTLAEWKVGAGNPPTNKQRQALAKDLRALVTQRLPRYHWIPVRIGESPAHVADFSAVTALPVAEVKGKAARVATLQSSWREQLPARYAAFMARVGTVDFKEDALSAEIERLVNAAVAG